MENEKQLSFLEHLSEFRRRLIVSLVAFGIGFIICSAFAKELFRLLMNPLLKVLPNGSSLIFTGVMEGFMTHLKVSMIGGLFLALPVVVYEIWMFIAPGLYKKEKRLFIPVAFFATFFFIGGALFGYFVVFPFAFQFLINNFVDDRIIALPTLSESFSFSITMLLIFGVVFELPLILFVLGRLGIVDHLMLSRARRYAIVIIFVASAIITPTTDAFTLFLMAGPLVILYEVSILAVRFFGKKKPRGQAAG
jgi:sec-independent protein translocase protein TatC